MTKRRRANLIAAVTTLRTMMPHELWEVPALTRIHLKEVSRRLQCLITTLEEKPK